MSKRQFKSQASSGRAGAGFGAFGGSSGFGSAQSSVLSYIQEPPDYSLISDPHVVVAFKNLSKKDSTTKAKALEDIQSSLTSTDDVEDAVVEAWVRLFPRLSIDNARRVRQLTHSLNGQLCAKCGKRIARQLPRISGPWLAGTFDVDRASAKAAQDALSTVFPTPEKVAGLRKTFHEPILDYSKDALLNETVQTLSDERTVNSEDAEATYARVVSTSLAVITSLLESLPTDEIDKQNHQYEAIYEDGKLWDLPSHADASIRRAAHRLVQTGLKLRPDFIGGNLKAVSKAYIYKGLPSNQTGSAVDFAQTVEALTASHLSIWTEAYSGKKSAVSRLQQCLKHGAHSGPANYWDVMDKLLKKIPAEVWPTSVDGVTDLLVAARDGVSRKEERLNASSAWSAYFALVDIATSSLSEEDVETVLEAFAMPPVNQYLHPSDDSARWTISGVRAASLVARVALIKRMPPLLEKKWTHLAGKLVELAKTSQPEQSKDYDKSQKAVAATGERWAALQRELFSESYSLPDNLRQTFLVTNTTIFTECVALLQSRKGKPYGAAAIIEEQLRACTTLLKTHLEFRTELLNFVENHLQALMFSPSQRYLPRCLYVLAGGPTFPKQFADILGSILDAEEPTEDKVKALGALFSPSKPQQAIELANASPPLQQFLLSLELGQNGSTALDLFGELLKIGVAAPETANSILSTLTQKLSLSGQESQLCLGAFEKLAATNQGAVQAFMKTDHGKDLLPNVLHLEQSANEDVADRATALSGRLSSVMGSAAADAKLELIFQNLEHVTRNSLSINALLDLSEKTQAASAELVNLKDSLPSIETWQQSIRSVMAPPKASLSILSPLGGAVHFVEEEHTDTLPEAHFDAEGLSQALRIAMYFAKIMQKPDTASKVGKDNAKILALLNICVLLAEDNTSIAGANGLWLAADQSIEIEVMDFVSDVNSVLRQYWESLPLSSTENQHTALFSTFENLRSTSKPHSAMAYYANLASAKAYENIFELHGYSTEQTKSAEEAFKARKAEKNPLALSSLLVGFAQPLAGTQVLTRLCNELVADLTDVPIESNQTKALELMAQLNIVLRTQEDVATSVQKTRLIFLVKRIIPWLDNATPLTVKAEVCKALASLSPTISDMYGEHWSQMIDLLSTYWFSMDGIAEDSQVSESDILLVHASLKLYSALHKLSQAEEANDDLLESLKESSGQLHNGMISLLKSVDGITDENHQPLMVTNELLARELSRVPFKPISDVEELFPLLFSPSHAIQGAAFNLLHKQIPAAQEQISFDAALDDKKAQLPDELLSLLLEAPTLDSLADASFDRVMPNSLQSFLFSWCLLFDHFQGSSFRVKSDYVEQIKEGGYLSGLLSLIFDFLGHTRGKPVDASKFDVQEYIADTEPSPERDVQWLLSHLFYLALLNLPSLVKSYFLDIRSRQTSQAIETWTAKYISPLIINASLQAVADWSEKSAKDDPDYENMTVKVGMRSREINVSYLVDEQTMAIKVVLPETYPIDSARVISVSRVAVKEEKWNSWLRNCQGVITFSNGSITDGLSAWRKNVTGALKGQSECAICYSIISGDKQLPTKRCPTCKNLFHSSCLFKWFKTSNASTCPLCRNPFNFN